MIQGAINEQYSHLRSYAGVLRRSNPNKQLSLNMLLGITIPYLKRYMCALRHVRKHFLIHVGS